MSYIKSILSWDTEYSADSVEWCPDSEFQNLFVCGTYKLQQNSTSLSSEHANSIDTKSTQCRVGRLYLFMFQNVESFLFKCQTIEMPAILDCKWCPVRVNDKVLLAVADADGKICVYQLSASGNLIIILRVIFYYFYVYFSSNC